MSTNGDNERIEIPGYEILKALPAGASGEVYLARENRDGGVQRVVKVFIPHPFADDQDPEPRFRSEVEALYRLQHRAVVRYVSSGVLTTPRPAFYLVMEFVPGVRLTDRCRTMPLESRVGLMIEILGGLHHVHQSKIFHRDIKPSNIMIRESDDQPVLVDFGLAYLVGDERDDDRTRNALGTPGYIPPEVANDPKRSRDPRHDIFQAGVVLYEILMGRLPREQYVSVETADRRLATLDPVLRRAMSPVPDTRFQTAADFAGALREWLQRDAIARSMSMQSNPSTLTFTRAVALQTRQLQQELSEQQERSELVATAINALAPTYEGIRAALVAIVEAARTVQLPVSLAALTQNPIAVSLSVLREHDSHVTLFECTGRPAKGKEFRIALDCEYRPLVANAWPLRFTLTISPGPDYGDNDVVHFMDGTPHTNWVCQPTTNKHFPHLLQQWLDEPAHWEAFDVV